MLKDNERKFTLSLLDLSLPHFHKVWRS